MAKHSSTHHSAQYEHNIIRTAVLLSDCSLGSTFTTWHNIWIYPAVHLCQTTRITCLLASGHLCNQFMCVKPPLQFVHMCESSLTACSLASRHLSNLLTCVTPSLQVVQFALRHLSNLLTGVTSPSQFFLIILYIFNF